MTPPLRVATRGSALARWQAERVIALLSVDAELVVITTAGDRDRDSPIHHIGGQGVFVTEVQDAVRDGRADLAVHSAKDLPPRTPPGLVLAAVPERADPRDALVGATLESLPTGGRVGTGSVRRRAQLAHHRPDLTFGELRGNVPTRLGRLDRFDAVVIAAAALDRLDLVDDRVHRVDPSTLLPQVAQGALAVECRADDDAHLESVRAIDDPEVRRAVDAERAFLDELGGGCDVPVGALAAVEGSGVTIDALVASLDGRIVLRATTRGDDPDATGRVAARDLIGQHGGRLVLEDLA
ncbi:MAG TPA: hydroxymethylbilane synthase [Acidimicrobiia bacterium]|nr:hydroxymethylbilane synthase [Acidimicrobiia bacterium]